MPITISSRVEKAENADKSAAELVRNKFDRLVAERALLKEQLKANSIALYDAVAAGRLFGVEIQLPAEIAAEPQDASPVAIQGSLFTAAGELTIRQAVLDQLEMAGEKGIKAAQLRRIIENMLARQLHYKTIGMTLYRLARDGDARRSGYIWYRVPKS